MSEEPNAGDATFSDEQQAHLEGTKICSRCGVVKPKSEFYADRRESRPEGSVRSACKECQEAERMKPENYQRVLESQKRRYHSRPLEERRVINRRTHLRDVYNITLVDYDAMLEAQGGGCAICGVTPEENGRRLCVDHDHEDGMIRGLLCTVCNAVLGWFEEDPKRFQDAIHYLNGG